MERKIERVPGYRTMHIADIPTTIPNEVLNVSLSFSEGSRTFSVSVQPETIEKGDKFTCRSSDPMTGVRHVLERRVSRYSDSKMRTHLNTIRNQEGKVSELLAGMIKQVQSNYTTQLAEEWEKVLE